MTKAYNTEIISVGTELLLGHVTNTDARDISELLSKIGINVLYHTVVGDNPRRLKQCVERAKERADIIITTGGLGPTYDDLTKQTICQAFGRELRFHPDILRPDGPDHAGEQPPAGHAAGGLHHLRQPGGHRPGLRLL